MSLDDNALMERIIRHDQRALWELYERYGKAVYSLAYRIVQSAPMAEEITQDTFLKVWEKKTTWDPAKGKLKSWLLAITHFTAIDRLRKEQRQPAAIAEAIDDDVVDALVSRRVESHATRWQDESMLHMLVAQLPAEQSQLIELAFFQGLTHTEIAARLRLPLGTVKTRVRAGLQRLKTMWMEKNI